MVADLFGEVLGKKYTVYLSGNEETIFLEQFGCPKHVFHQRLSLGATERSYLYFTFKARAKLTYS